MEAGGRHRERGHWADPSGMLPITRFNENYKNPRSSEGFVPSRRLKYEIEKDFDADPKKNTPKVLAEKYGITRDHVRGIITLKHVAEGQDRSRAKIVAEAYKELTPTREDLPFLSATEKMPNVDMRDAIDAFMGCDPRMNIDLHLLRAPDTVLTPKKSPLPTFLTDDQLAQLIEKEKPGIKFRSDLVDKTFWPQRDVVDKRRTEEERRLKGSTDLPKQKAKRSFTFVDMSKDATPKVRSVLRRDNDGKLREADFVARRRLNNKANPQPNFRKHSWLESRPDVQNMGAAKFERNQKRKWGEQPCVAFFAELRASQAELPPDQDTA